MNQRRTSMAILAAASQLLLAGCGNTRACAVDAECFSGEYCAEQECVVGEREDNATPNSSANNASDAGNDAPGPQSDVAMNSETNSTTDGTCALDPFGSTCTDDEFEENDLYQNPVMSIDQQAWCLDGALATPIQTFEGTLCAGDRADHFRLQIDNRSPHACLADSFTLKIVVEFDVPCGEDLVRVVPYYSFDNPNLNSQCDTNPDFRCTTSADNKTYTIEWVRNAEQLADSRLMIEGREDDIQASYTVTVEVIQ